MLCGRAHDTKQKKRRNIKCSRMAYAPTTSDRERERDTQCDFRINANTIILCFSSSFCSVNIGSVDASASNIKQETMMMMTKKMMMKMLCVMLI